MDTNATSIPRATAPREGDRETLYARLAREADARTEGELDFAFRNDLGGVPNRARVKVFRPREQRRVVAFFYKRSLLPHSRDRFAYGCCVAREETVDEAMVRAWFDFARSGFAPEKRPPGWMRGVPFEVPE